MPTPETGPSCRAIPGITLESRRPYALSNANGRRENNRTGRFLFQQQPRSIVGERKYQPINTITLAIMVAGGLSPGNDLLKHCRWCPDGALAQPQLITSRSPADLSLKASAELRTPPTRQAHRNTYPPTRCSSNSSLKCPPACVDSVFHLHEC